VAVEHCQNSENFDAAKNKVFCMHRVRAFEIRDFESLKKFIEFFENTFNRKYQYFNVTKIEVVNVLLYF
jgi:hypothetical protein